MRVVLKVTGGASGGNAFENAIRVAGGALGCNVPAFQFEGEHRMIHAAFPSVGSVTGGAVRSESAVVFVVHGMAGMAIGWNASINAILVTFATCNACVSSGEFENRNIVIELRIFCPTAGGMARATLHPKATLVEVIFLMTGVTILWGGFQIVEIAGIGVTTGTGGLRMQAGEGEGRLGVVELGAVRIDPIVAGEAIRPKSEDVFLCEQSVCLQVAIGANSLIERPGIAVGMAVAAFEGRTVHSQRMSIQRVSQQAVRIPIGLHLRYRGVEAAMLGVAGAAVEVGVAEAHQAVQALRRLQFESRLRVARETAISHAVAVPRRCVASATFLDGRVRSDASQQESALGA